MSNYKTIGEHYKSMGEEPGYIAVSEVKAKLLIELIEAAEDAREFLSSAYPELTLPRLNKALDKINGSQE